MRRILTQEEGGAWIDPELIIQAELQQQRERKTNLLMTERSAFS